MKGNVNDRLIKCINCGVQFIEHIVIVRKHHPNVDGAAKVHHATKINDFPLSCTISSQLVAYCR